MKRLIKKFSLSSQPFIRRSTYAVVCLLVLSSCGNPSLQPLPAEGRILCFGDSLTRGIGTTEPHSYPTILAELSGRTVENFGVPGETSREGVIRLQDVLEKHSPALLVLCHGGNDILQRLNYNDLKKNLVAMIELCKQKNIQVVLIAVPSVLSDSHPVYAQVAEEMAIPIEPSALGKLIKDDDYKSDQVHLNAAGYRKLAEAVHKLLKANGAFATKE